MSVRAVPASLRRSSRALAVLLAVPLLAAFAGEGAAHDRRGLATPGPLVVSDDNPRYFAVAGKRGRNDVVYLTGSHIWNNLHDGLGPGQACPPVGERQDYDAYLDFLEERGHNFIRFWRWEQFQSSVPGFHLCMTPQPWKRSGSGSAADGRPRFDLTRFDERYFDRLRSRVVAAGRRGIYASVMLFEGFCLKHCQRPNNLAGHPFHAANNVNGIAIGSITDYQVLPIDPRVRALQEAYIRKVVDTVQDLPNVLYEVANESSGDPASEWGDSTQWQYGVIDYLKRYERRRGYVRHPIGMTYVYPDAHRNASLFDGPADWVSPGFEGERPGFEQDPWFADPPANDGTRYPVKVVITDTDHYAAGYGNAMWAWKSFLRGLNPILMDYGIIDVVNPLDPSLGVPSFESFEPARYAMGDTLRFAEALDLADMEPRGDLSSTGYALADPGREYLALQPSAQGEAFTLRLASGRYRVAWYSVDTRERRRAAGISLRGPRAVTLTPPFGTPGPAVVHLERLGR